MTIYDSINLKNMLIRVWQRAGLGLLDDRKFYTLAGHKPRNCALAGNLNLGPDNQY